MVNRRCNYPHKEQNSEELLLRVRTHKQDGSLVSHEQSHSVFIRLRKTHSTRHACLDNRLSNFQVLGAARMQKSNIFDVKPFIFCSIINKKYQNSIFDMSFSTHKKNLC